MFSKITFKLKDNPDFGNDLGAGLAKNKYLKDYKDFEEKYKME